MHRSLIRSSIPLGLALLALLGLLILAANRASQATADPAATTSPTDVEITVDEIVVSGLNRPVQVTHAGDGSGRLFAVEKGGRIRVITAGTILTTPFLDIAHLVDSDAYERGLLGLAFHPDYAHNGYFYVNYTRQGAEEARGDTVIARYTVSATHPNVADPASAMILMTVDQPDANHNGGQLLFGPQDGYLYIGMGDGGGGGDTYNNGQNKDTLLGAMLRIDVDGGTPYTVPVDNPYVGAPGADEIWAIGLRNPWRFSFDRATGDLYIGDVGQNAWEEIDYLPAGTSGEVNLGWPCREGTHSYRNDPPCDDPDFLANLIDPIAEYANSGANRAVTGGFVYRGTDYASLVGRYFFADYASGIIWSMVQIDANRWTTPELELDTGLQISAFGEDEQGELYLVDDGGGTIRRLADANGPAPSPDLSTSEKYASTSRATASERVTFTIRLSNTGDLADEAIFVTDTVPPGLNYVSGSLTATHGIVTDAQAPVLRWQGALTPCKIITITYLVTPSGDPGSFVNQVRLTGATIQPITLSYALFVPPVIVTSTQGDFFLPGTQPGHLEDEIPTAASCDTCHTAPIFDDWRGSMMSQSGRDPLLWAALAVADNDAPGAGEFCLRCHTPKGWLEGRSHPTNGSALIGDDVAVGVACEVCHRLVDPIPSTAPTDETAQIDALIRAALTTTVSPDHPANAMMIVDPHDNRRGPFAFDPPLSFHTAYRSSFFAGSESYYTASRMCGTCHNVDNPTLSWDEARGQYWPNESDAAAPSVDNGQLFPLERTFDEWANSAYATEEGVYAPQFAGDKPDGIVRSCQDCHMRRVTGIAADEAFDPVDRDCVTTGCLPEHDLMGGNAWVPQILQDSRWRLHSAPDAPYLDDAILRAHEMLERAATLTVTIETSGTHNIATVRVINETGHKLPTGYPEGRRMWIQLQAFDGDDALVFQSGAYDPETGVLTQTTDLVYEVKQGLTPELAAALGRTALAGETFHFVLNNSVIKDNRIPPRGYTQAAFDQPGLRPVGTTYADGQYWADSTYLLPEEAQRVVATLYYQTASKEYIDFLRANGGVDGVTLGTLWETSKSPPVVMATATFSVTDPGVPPDQWIFMPLILGQN